MYFLPQRVGVKKLGPKKLGAVRWGKKLHATLQALHREKQYEDEQVNKSIKAVGNVCMYVFYLAESIKVTYHY